MSELAVVALMMLQAAAQVPPQSVLARRVDSLTRAYRESVRREDRVELRRATDTMVAGPLTVALSPKYRARFARALPRVAADWSRLLGANPPSVGISVVSHDGLSILQARWSDVAIGPRAGTSVLDSRGKDATPDVYRSLWDALAAGLSGTADSALRGWLPVTIRPLPALYDDDELAYQWAVARGAASQACRSGQRARCAAALGLESSSEKELTLAIRGAVLASALDRGGTGAWRKLIGTAGQPLTARMEAVAGIPLPDLVMNWQAALMERRRRSEVEDSVRWSLGALWVVGIGLVALMGRRR